MKKIIAAVLCLVLAIVPLAPRASAAPTAASDALVEFIKSQEGFVDHVYYAGGYAYIGYGQMVNPSDWPNGITEEQATALLRSTLATIADAVNRYAASWKTVMNQGQFDAVLSLTYNLGTSWLTKNGKLITALRAGTQLTPVQAADCFGVHCHAGGINEHLIKRRLYEADMFSYGNYTGAHIADYTWLVLQFNGGDADNDIAFFLKGRPYGTLPEAWRSGYYFAGWSTGSAILKPTDVASGKLTVTATW
ncbi:MAG: lysozyme, partial [Oscillospiraceae bacterium]|nr:lysozyme [Oscillospiraceae bacterium]